MLLLLLLHSRVQATYMYRYINSYTQPRCADHMAIAGTANFDMQGCNR